VNAAPITLPGGSRTPPRPPIRTGFAGFGSSGDDYDRVFADAVRRVVAALNAAPVEELPYAVSRVESYRRMVEDELMVVRAVESGTLPPTAFLYLTPLDEETPAVLFYRRLADSLDAALTRARGRAALRLSEPVEPDNHAQTAEAIAKLARRVLSQSRNDTRETRIDRLMRVRRIVVDACARVSAEERGRALIDAEGHPLRVYDDLLLQIDAALSVASDPDPEP
jgi:hypothetical protein